jgi:hypothetical protein
MIIYFERGEKQKSHLRGLFGRQKKTDLSFHFGKIEDTDCYWYNISGNTKRKRPGEGLRSREHLKFITEIAI